MKSFIKRELQTFFTAMIFYTRIPYPFNLPYSQELLNRATMYFPLIGWLAGVFFWLSAMLLITFLPVSVTVIISVALGVLLTGAFHEDGFADCCDGFGGGYGREQILRIMKDSRLGTFGVIGLFLLLATKCSAIMEIFQRQDIGSTIFIFIGSHAFSRWAAAYVICRYEYAREEESSKTKPLAKKPGIFPALMASFWGLLPLFFLPWQEAIAVFLLCLSITELAAFYFYRHIGGYTGDCLGAIQQMTELAFLLVALIFIGSA
jgi:adenosylcobinamide-GDP ribazoletransferase